MPSKPPSIHGVIETILYVDDLTRAIAFYRDVLGLALMTGDPARFQSFDAGAKGVVLLFKRGSTLSPTLVSGGVIPAHDGSGPHHIGFAISASDYDSWRHWLRECFVTVESEANWPRGGRSLYFRDPDNHLLELITPGIWPNY